MMSIFLLTAILKNIPIIHHTKSVIYDAVLREVENTGTSRRITKTPPVIIPSIPQIENTFSDL